MASIGGVSSNNTTSSLYNSANVISGLASGLDTEGMIEGLVKSYQTKIQNLTNKATKIEWKQEAYRSIISKMYAFSNKYASYSSSTNLLSASFFNNAVKIASMGVNKDAVSASGRTDSDIKLTSVKQLATSARYSTASNLKGISDDFSIAAEKAVNFTDEYESGALSGSLTLTYGGKTVSVVFDPSTDIIADKVYKTDANGEYELDGNGKRIVVRDRTSEEKAEDLKNLIEKKLDDSKITLSSGETKNATDLIEVSLNGGQISFKDKTTGGNNVYISDASSSVKNTLGLDLEDAAEKKPNSFTIGTNTKLTKTEDVGSKISGASMNISLDGKTKTIKLPTLSKTYDGYNMNGDEYAKAVQEAVDKEFGKGKITVTNEAEDGDGLKLKFKAPDNSDLIINSDAGKALGIGNVSTNYLSTSKTLGDLMGKEAWSSLGDPVRGVGATTTKDGKLYDAKGNLVNENGNLIDKDGNELYAFSINGVTIGNYGKGTQLSTIMSDINSNTEAGVKVSYSQTTRKFTFTSKETGSENGIEFDDGLAQKMFGSTGSTGDKVAQIYDLDLSSGGMKEITFDTSKARVSVPVSASTTMDDIVRELNDSPLGMQGYTASYNKTSGQIVVTDKTGKTLEFTVKDKDGKELKSTLTSSYTPGRDAVFSAEINGEEMIMTRGSNNFSLDGMTVNLKATFNDDYINDAGDEFVAEKKPIGDNIVTFQRSTDSDKIVDAVKSMITDYNEMIAEIRSQYATLPYQNSSGAFQTYEPLSDEDKASMSESAIQNYEAKAKQGILFGDRNLSNLYSKLTSIFTSGGTDQAKLREMGISITYSSDSTPSLSLDESKLRSMLESDPDAVTDAFTRSVDSGASSDGVMQQLKNHLDTYGRTTGAVKGILVEQAGTPLSSLTLMSNTWQKQIDNINNEITKWQDKLSAQVDKYTSMFSKLETLIYQMNSQSSTLAGLMGG